MVQGAASDVLLLPLETKKTFLRSQTTGRKICTLCSALQLGSSEKIQSVPHEETGVCWNRAGIRPGTLRAVGATILLKTGASFWISRRYGGVGRPRIRSAHGNSSCLLAFHKKWSELQNNLREYNRLFFLFGKLTSIYVSTMTLSQFIDLTSQ